jgi:heme A synthase
METRLLLQRESFKAYNFAISLVVALILFEVFLGWYLVSQDYGRVSYIRILLTIAVLIGLWVQSHAARYLGAIWLLLSVVVLIWMLFAAHKVAFNFAALLVFVCAGLSLVASYIVLFSKKFKAEYARKEKIQPHYKRILSRGLIALVISLFVFAILHDIYHLFSP